MIMKPTTGSSTVIMYVALALTWGASFLLITLALRELSPIQVVLGRLGFGAICLLVLCRITRTALPRPSRLWWHLLVIAVVMCVIPFTLYAVAQSSLTSGTASVLNATTPLMAAIVGVIMIPDERLPARGVLGLLAGFAGVIVVIAGSHAIDGSGSVLPELACLGATACYGFGFNYLRRYVSPSGLTPLAVATMQVTFAAVIALLLALPVLSVGALPDPRSPGWPAAVISVIVLGAVGTGVAYLWNTTIVQRWGATAASTVTYLTPAVGVGLGALVLAEPVGWNLPIGAAVIVVGIVLIQTAARRRISPRPGRDN